MEWLRVPLKKIANVVSGFGFPQEYQGIKIGQYPFFKVSDMNAQGNEVFMSDAVNMISEQALNELKATIFPAGTVIFPKIGAAIATGKKRILVKPSTFDNNIMGLVPKSNVDYRFLYYWSLTFDFQSIANIGPVPSLRKSTIEQIDIPLPPISEQRRIVEILDRADDLRKKRSQADRISDRILPALFIKMFGDPATNPMGWQLITLNDILTDIQSGWSPVCDNRPAEIEEWGVLKLSAVTYGQFNPCENKAMLSKESPRPDLEVQNGDLLVTRKNTYDLVGASAFVYQTRPKLMLSDLIFRLKLSELADPVYIWQILSQKSIRNKLSQLAGGSAGSMPNISKARLRTLVLPMPPKTVQIKYRKIIDCFWEKLEQQELSSKILDKLFQTLLHQAFSGELTAKWRESHMKELLQEMEHQAKALNLSNSETEQLTLNL